MVDFRDRRSKSGTAGPGKAAPDAEGRERQEAERRDPRSFGAMFAPDQLYKGMNRGEVLGLLGMIEHGRRAHRWPRVLRRWLEVSVGFNRTWPFVRFELPPAPKDYPALLAQAHQRTIDAEVARVLEAQRRTAEAKAAAPHPETAS